MAASASNMLICATSNRRHLPPEFIRDNLGHTMRLVVKSIPARRLRKRYPSRSLWSVDQFYPFSQNEYLTICAPVVARLAGSRGGN